MAIRPDHITGNAVIGQAGGPTAVINQSLVGVIEGLHEGLVASGRATRILGMKHGVNGLVRDELIDLSGVSQDRLERLAATPSACLGSTRDKPDAAYGQRILESCRQHDIRYFFYIGGNDSADTCRIVHEAAEIAGYELHCFHVPKTVDNDLVENDHCPGYPSAARYVALAFMGDFLDNCSLPGVKINVIMGRNAGWLTAAASLARRSDPAAAPWERDGPQLIYVPETPFDPDQFIADVESVYSKKGRCHVAVSEGIRDANGEPIGPTLMAGAQVDSHGNVQLSGSGALGDALADLVKARLTPAGGKAPRVRADTFGYVQRCWHDASPIDQREARACGRYAAELPSVGKRSGSIALVRAPDAARGRYRSECRRVNLSAVAGKTRTLPPEFLDGSSNVSVRFLDYAQPIVGELPQFEKL